MYDAWKNKVLAGPPIDIDNSGDFDCVDVPKSWAVYLFPGVSWQKTIGYGNAKDLYMGANTKYFQKIPYTKGLIPKQGDIMVFGATPAPGYTNQFVNPYGHTGVVDSANSSGYTLIQQESGTGSKPHLATWPWNYRPPIAFLRPLISTGGTEVASTKFIQQAYLAVLHRAPDAGGLQHYSLAPYNDPEFILNDLMNSAERKKLEAAKPASTPAAPVNRATVLDYVNKNLK